MPTPVDGDLYPSEFYTKIGPFSTAIQYRKNVLGEIVMGVKESAPDGTYYLVNPKQYNTDNQSLQVVLAANQSPMATANDDDSELCTTAYMHCDATGSEGSFCSVYDDRIEVGTFTHSDPAYVQLPSTLPSVFIGGAVFTKTIVATWASPRPIVAQNRIEFRNNGTAFTVFIDDVEKVSATINPTRDSSHRHSMVSVMRKTFSTGGVGGFPLELPSPLAGDPEAQDSFWVSLILASDYIPQSYLGSGAKMISTVYAPAGYLTASAGGYGTPFPAGFFDTTVRATSDIISIPASGAFIVAVEGWYEVKLNLLCAVTSSAFMLFGLLKNGVLHEFGTALIGDGNPSYPQQAMALSAWTVYLTPNDSIQPSMYFQPGSGVGALYGSFDAMNPGAPPSGTSGASGYFTITLANRSIT